MLDNFSDRSAVKLIQVFGIFVLIKPNHTFTVQLPRTRDVRRVVGGTGSYPRASEAGLCRGSDTLTIYVGDIDMYIHPTKI